jgi:hypothetical protein
MRSFPYTSHTQESILKFLESFYDVLYMQREVPEYEALSIFTEI